MSLLWVTGAAFVRLPAGKAEAAVDLLPTLLPSGFFTDVAVTGSGNLVIQFTAALSDGPMLAAYEWKQHVRAAVFKLSRGADIPALRDPEIGVPGFELADLRHLRNRPGLAYTATAIFSVDPAVPALPGDLARGLLNGAFGRLENPHRMGDDAFAATSPRQASPPAPHAGDRFVLTQHRYAGTWSLTTDGSASVPELWDLVQKGTRHIGLTTCQKGTHQFSGTLRHVWQTQRERGNTTMVGEPPARGGRPGR